MAGQLRYPSISRLSEASIFRSYIKTLGIQLPFDEEIIKGEENPLAQPYMLPGGRVVGNRFCCLPMEGWDGTPGGEPTELTLRRWRNFGLSGAKLVWGGEAVAVRTDGRANPNQLVISESTLPGLENLHRQLLDAHRQSFGSTDSLLVGLQLTHSGRFSRPHDHRLEPLFLYHHPLLDDQVGITPSQPALTDGEIEGLIEDFLRAAALVNKLGFEFVDIKHCHGYLGHEFLAARTRPGKYGGTLENRTRFMRQVIQGIQSQSPGLLIGVRLSLFDFPPFRVDSDGGTAQPSTHRDENGQYPYGFGVDPRNPLVLDLSEPFSVVEMLLGLGVNLVCATAGSPYYNPHIQRPAYFPPSDGYPPPEDPLVGVARQIQACAELKQRFPQLALVGSAYSYLQEWLVHVAQGAVRRGMVDFVGLGRCMLSYPQLPADFLSNRELDRKRLCRTFSDCTTAPRQGMVSGCYPLDEFYKTRPEEKELKIIKKRIADKNQALK
ncbi:MAG: NADH:flavin oxidoreductase [Chloroflexi bacterium RBG_16_54_18]|nr:MAG: NADH:flavin oxidoreductase [Chloroflexi bacterium RBG_16_54_18]